MKPLFLISNDDGIHAKGLHTLIDLLRPHGDIAAVVPDNERSGMSTAFTMTHPLGYRLARQETGLTIWECNGTPADCVKIALKLLLKERRPDFVFSGINHGYNGSVSIHYSGTLGVAQEGCMSGLASVAFSLDNYDPDADFSQALPYVEKIALNVIRHGLPPFVSLNVNLPPGPIAGMRICRQGAGRFEADFSPCPHPKRPGLYWQFGHFVNLEPADSIDDDLKARADGYVSIVPQQIDATAYAAMDMLKKWEW